MDCKERMSAWLALCEPEVDFGKPSNAWLVNWVLKREPEKAKALRLGFPLANLSA